MATRAHDDLFTPDDTNRLLDSLRCQAPDPLPRGRRETCGTPLLLSSPTVLARLAIVGITDRAPESSTHTFVRCPRKACGAWNEIEVKDP